MPWHVAKSTSCPDSKPWAVIKDADGSVAGCHATREAANLQVAALYAQESWEEMQHKAFSVDVKADSDGEAGSFEALVAVFGLDDEKLCCGQCREEIDEFVAQARLGHARRGERTPALSRS